jgi:hypothetical protein
VRCGLEQALLHATGWHRRRLLGGGEGGGATTSTATAYSPVLVNALATRSSSGVAATTRTSSMKQQQQRRQQQQLRVVKVKVGGASVEEDVARVCAIASSEEEGEPSSTSTSISTGSSRGGNFGNFYEPSALELRLDANEAWSPADAAAFWAALPPAVRALVAYVEEPINLAAAAAAEEAAEAATTGTTTTSTTSTREEELLLAPLVRLRTATAAAAAAAGSGDGDDDDDEEGLLPMPVALDESLLRGVLDPYLPREHEQHEQHEQQEQQEALLDEALAASGVVALVLKPSLLAPSRTVALAALARRSAQRSAAAAAAGGGGGGGGSSPQPLQAVLSAAFDGDVGLAHQTLLAATTAATAAATTTRHGLSTYRQFAAGASEFQAAAVLDDDQGAIDTLSCLRLLDRKAAAHLRSE